MFLDKLNLSNEKLVSVSVSLLNNGIITPDTYVLDIDMIAENAKKMLEVANKKDISLYFMLKQIGRNPIIAKKLMQLGFKGAVVVDFYEGLAMMENNIPIGHLGHLVQTPKGLLDKFIRYGVNIITCYSFEKLHEINDVACACGKIQRVSMRIVEEGDNIYDGQIGGFSKSEIIDLLPKIKELKNIKFEGLTSFPCYLFDESKNEISATKNLSTIRELSVTLKQCGIDITELNTPSSTCVKTLSDENFGNVGEPGHGLTGTTPFHKYNNAFEKVAIAYVSEVSHNYKNEAFCYGGGHYRRSHLNGGLVFESCGSKKVEICAVKDESIDYHFTIKENCEVSSPVVMCFRTQIFVTRSRVCVVSGVNSDEVKVLGIFDGLGRKI